MKSVWEEPRKTLTVEPLRQESSSAMQPVRHHLSEDETQGDVGMNQELNPFSTLLCKINMAPMQEPKIRSYKVL